MLILWGVIKLVEHTTANRQGYRAAGIGAGSVLLLILIIIFGLGAHYSSDVNWGGVRDQIQIDDDLGGMFGNAYTYDDTIEQSFPGDGNLRIVSDRGAITVQPSDGDTIKVVVHKKLYANNQSDADKYNQGSKPIITVNGTSVLLNANTNGAGDHGVTADMDVYVPRKAALDMASRRGDLNITDRKGDVKISGQHGDVTLNDITGAVKVNLEKGSVRVTKVVGDVDIDGRIDDANVDDVNGSVRLNGDFFDNIHLSKIAKTVTFKSSHSDLTLASVPGRSGDLRRLAARNRRDRSITAGDALERSASRRRERRPGTGVEQRRHRGACREQAAARQDDDHRQEGRCDAGAAGECRIPD